MSVRPGLTSAGEEPVAVADEEIGRTGVIVGCPHVEPRPVEAVDVHRLIRGDQRAHEVGQIEALLARQVRERPRMERVDPARHGVRQGRLLRVTDDAIARDLKHAEIDLHVLAKDGHRARRVRRAVTRRRGRRSRDR